MSKKAVSNILFVGFGAQYGIHNEWTNVSHYYGYILHLDSLFLVSMIPSLTYMIWFNEAADIHIYI